MSQVVAGALLAAKRQQQGTDGENAGSASEGSFDSRWFLLLIPIILLFLGLLAGVWCLVRRRRRRRQRRSVLRNVTLVVAHEEKERERALSRGNSLVSRIGSTKSKSGRDGYRTARRAAAAAAARGDDDGHLRTESGSSNSHMTSSAGHKDAYLIETRERLKPTAENENDVDLEQGQDDEHENEDEIKEIGSQEGSYPISSGHILMKTHQHKKELSVIGETKPGEDEEGSPESRTQSQMGNASTQQERASPVTVPAPAALKASTTAPSAYRQNSAGSSAPPTSAVSFKDPFATPTATSSGHGQRYNDTPTASPIARQQSPYGNGKSDEDGSTSASPLAPVGGLVRRLSDVVRIRQPSPSASKQRALSPPTNPPLSRSASNHSRGGDNYKRAKESPAKGSRSSLKSRSSVDVASVSSPKLATVDLPGGSAAEAASPPTSPVGAWTYVSREHEWNSSSPAVASQSTTKNGTATSASAAGKETHDSNDSGMTTTGATSPIGKGDPPLSPLSNGLGRKPSIGVAGSRFKEAFDD